MGKVQKIFSLIITKILHSYILQALGINEKGIYSVLNDSISNLDLELFKSLNTF